MADLALAEVNLAGTSEEEGVQHNEHIVVSRHLVSGMTKVGDFTQGSTGSSNIGETLVCKRKMKWRVKIDKWLAVQKLIISQAASRVIVIKLTLFGLLRLQTHGGLSLSAGTNVGDSCFRHWMLYK